MVVPKALRDLLGLRPGEVELTADGSALRVEPMSAEGLEEQGSRLVIPSADEPLTASEVRAARHGDQR